MKKLKKFFLENKLTLYIGIVVVIVLALPIFRNNMFLGDDYEYHMARIQSISDSIKSNIFPVKVHSQMANGYGYASGLFYPNFFLYIPAILLSLGLNIINSYKIFLILMFIFMFFLTYISLQNIFENKKISLIGTILIMLSKAMSLHIYQRFALGEFLGTIFIAPVISGMYDYIYKDFKKPYLLFLGFFGLINSHLLTTAICLIFCIIYFLCHPIKSIFSNHKKFIKLIIVATLTILSTCFFWLPMIEQLLSQKFNFTNQWTDITNFKYNIPNLFGFNHRYTARNFTWHIYAIYIYRNFFFKSKTRT
ncbi:MAG: YfhO family protein [Clostridia bacterium]|nr:YfhO family protein [Clostridia bacterium]